MAEKLRLDSFLTSEGYFESREKARNFVDTYNRETKYVAILKEHKANLPFAEIWDKPDYKRRNYMLDISRCRIPKVEVIEKYIDLIADLKYNEFQLYFQNFCFKFSKIKTAK